MSSEEISTFEIPNETLEKFKNLKLDDLVRGATPDNIEKECLKLCQQFIGGAWNKAKSCSDIEVKRISGGLTNQLYRVALKTPNQSDFSVNDDASIPKEVSIKLYMKKHMPGCYEQDERFNDLIISVMTSSKNIGPILYGVFPNGVVQAYYEHQQFRPKHQKNPVLLKKLAHLLAKVNLMLVPLPRNRFWLIDSVEKFIKDSYEFRNVETLAKELNLKTIAGNDLRKEIKFLKKALIEHHGENESVFCHNDFRGSNILVVNDNTDIVLCDYEYCAYGFRGHDLASFLCEWDHELFEFENMELPNDDVIKHFCQLYLEGCDEIKPGYSSKKENSVDKLLVEVHLGFLSNLMFFFGFMLNQKESLIESIPYDFKGNLFWMEKIYAIYLNIKNKLIEKNLINPSN